MKDEWERDMRNRFDKLIDIIMAHEGGYVNDPLDPGGETKYGISKRQYPDLDIKELKQEEARAIYEFDYYSHHMDYMVSERLALLLFDFGVNAGVGRATRKLQELVGADTDGVLGPVTVHAANVINQERLIRDYAVQLNLYYYSLERPEFLFGWIKRLMDNLTRVIV